MRSHQSKRPVLAISAIVAILTIVLPTDDLKSVGLVDLPRDEPEDVGMSSDRLQRIDSTMQRYIDSNQLEAVRSRSLRGMERWCTSPHRDGDIKRRTSR